MRIRKRHPRGELRGGEVEVDDERAEWDRDGEFGGGEGHEAEVAAEGERGFVGVGGEEGVELGAAFVECD